MKGGLCIIYTSLLTISVLSSCAFFILVLSEALQADDVNNNVDLSGLHNVSQKSSSIEEESQKPDTQHKLDNMSEEKQTEELNHQMKFPDTLSVNSVTTDGLPDTGQPPILISLAENAKLDLRAPEDLLFSNESEQHNETTSFAIIDSADGDEKEGNTEVTEKPSTEPRLIVKAKPLQDIRQAEELLQSATVSPDVETVEESHVEENLEENIPTKPETPQEDIPSFSEWAQKQLAEAEKKDTVLNHSSQPSHSNTNFSSKNTKLRSKNYASPACGAKVVAVNPEAGSASSILSPNRDEYMLNTCNSRIWFVVELCEAVQAQKIEIANFELFSSTPKDIAVGFSDRFPVREWTSVGQFTAQDIRDVQSFDLYPHIFGKFIRVEMLSHHGSEHYCPISLFKVYGTSEFEVLEKESSQHSAHIDEDEEDEIIDIPDIPAAEAEPSKNLFGSARDAVMSIMKKAAQALVKTEVPNNVSSEHNDTSTDNMYKKCCSPSHIIVCDNCSETLYNDVYELLSCSSDKLTSLVRQVFLRDTLKCTCVCQNYGLEFKSTKTIEFGEERAAYVNAFFPPKYIAALCNILAIKEKKVVLNTSFETEMNVTSNITSDETPQKINSDTNVEQEMKLVPIKDNNTEDKSNDTTESDEKTVVPELNIEHAPPIELPKDDKDKKDVFKEDLHIEEQQPVLEPQDDSVPEEKQVEEKNESESKDSPKTENKNGKDAIIEKPKETTNHVVDENNDQVIMESDSFMSELDQMAVDPTPAGTHALLNQNQAQATLQKESVFLRLSNRVKTLERNMSLSGQYLEELSRRYKKQVEEMQKSFEKTMLQMSEERRKSNEREQKYLEQMTNLQDQIAHMTIALQVLIEEKESWFGNITFCKFLVYQSIIIIVAFYYISKKKKPESILVPIPKKTKKKQDKFRRKSVEGVSGHETPSTKKRRPSEEAFQIARHSTEETEAELNSGEWQVAKKNRRRKPSIIVHRNMEAEIRNNVTSTHNCVRELQENPITLDEAEFFAPVSEPKEFTENKEKELPKSNGSFFNNLKTRTMKTRRLSSPAFLRSFNRQSSRSTPSPVVRTLEPIFNGKLSKKAASESPTGSLWSESTDISQNGHHDSESGGKKKKSLRNILKKVF